MARKTLPRREYQKLLLFAGTQLFSDEPISEIMKREAEATGSMWIPDPDPMFARQIGKRFTRALYSSTPNAACGHVVVDLFRQACYRSPDSVGQFLNACQYSYFLVVCTLALLIPSRGKVEADRVADVVYEVMHGMVGQSFEVEFSD